MNLTSGLERWDPFALWGVASVGLLLGGTLLVRQELQAVLAWGCWASLLASLTACMPQWWDQLPTCCVLPADPCSW